MNSEDSTGGTHQVFPNRDREMICQRELLSALFGDTKPLLASSESDHKPNALAELIWNSSLWRCLQILSLGPSVLGFFAPSGLEPGSGSISACRLIGESLAM